MVKAGPLLVITLGVIAARGQNAGGDSATSRSCSQPTSQYEGFTIRQFRINAPFGLPVAVQSNLEKAGTELPRTGEPWRQAAMGEVTKAVVNAVTKAPLPELPFHITAVPVFIENCDPATKQLDVAVHVFGTRLFIPGLWSWESVQTLREDPRTASGMLPSGYRVRIAPLLRYDKSDSLAAGGRLLIDRAGSGFRLLAEGAGANRFANASMSASGEVVPERSFLWHLAYAAGYRLTDEPLVSGGARQGYGFGWLSGATRPLRALGGAVRYALQYERGYQSADSSIASAPAFVNSTRYSAVKLLAGASGGAGRHDYSVTTGFQIGSAGGITNAYGKTIVDGKYAVRLAPGGRLFDHRFIDLEFHGTAGWLGSRNNGRIPVNERFFGGIRERRFTDLPAWDVRSAPVIRSFPSNRFLPPADGAAEGRERFLSCNVTVAFTTFRLPLIPGEVRELQGFKDQIKAGKGTALESLLSYHESKDPAMDQAAAAAGELDPVLTSLLEAVEGLTVPDSLSDARDTCRDAVEDSQTMLGKAQETRAFAALLNKTSQGALLPLLNACGEDLKAANSPLTEDLAKVSKVRSRIDEVIQKRIDHGAVKSRAEEDSRIAIRALDAFEKEINLVSLDPVIVFDRACIRSGPSPTPSLVRYGAGGGLRVTLASTISFQAGYAVNVNRAPGEARGAFFFGLRFYDLIR